MKGLWKLSFRWKASFLIGCLVCGGVAKAADAPAAGAPSTDARSADAPAAPDPMAALVRQLGDDDFAARETAAAKLSAAGKGAVRALKSAANDPDPEIRSRAAQLLQRLESRPLPGPDPDAAGGASREVRVSIDDGTKVTDVSANGQVIHIEQSGDGIKMTITGYVGKRRATERYDAPDADALRKAHPDAYALWRRWNAQDGEQAVMQVGGGVLIIRPQVAREHGDDLTALTGVLHRQMDKARLSDDQRQDVLDEIGRVHDAQGAIEPGAGPEDHEKQVKAYVGACDALRKKLADLNLPDPGAALPPPASARLGVQVSADAIGAEGGGVTIGSVEENSRGARLGLRTGDVVHAVNGQRVQSVHDLRAEVIAHPRLVLAVTRAGQEVKLEEPVDQPREKAGAVQ